MSCAGPLKSKCTEWPTFFSVPTRRGALHKGAGCRQEIPAFACCTGAPIAGWPVAGLLCRAPQRIADLMQLARWHALFLYVANCHAVYLFFAPWVACLFWRASRKPRFLLPSPTPPSSKRSTRCDLHITVRFVLFLYVERDACVSTCLSRREF